MSQHTFDCFINNKEVQVLLGWDEELDYFFCKISPYVNKASFDIGTPIYSNLLEPHPFYNSLDHYIMVCRHYGIIIPKTIIKAVSDDKALNQSRYLYYGSICNIK